MIVITIILILIGIAAGRYEKSVMRAREATLKQDLQAMRQSIDNYTLDKQAAPQSLDDLAQAGYLRMVPKDPMTGATDWDLQFDSVVLSPDQSGTGLVDIHSHSGLTSPFEGTPYNQWQFSFVKSGKQSTILSTVGNGETETADTVKSSGR